MKNLLLPLVIPLAACAGIDPAEVSQFQAEIHPAVQSIPAVAAHVKRLVAAGWSRSRIEANLGVAAVQEAIAAFPALFAGMPVQ